MLIFSYDHKLRKFLFYRRHHELVSKFNCMGRTEFSDKFQKVIIHHKRNCYNSNVK